MDNLAIVLRDQGKLDEARKLYEQTLEIRRRVLGPEHPDTLTVDVQSGLMCCVDQGKHDEAGKLFEQTLEIATPHPRPGASRALWIRCTTWPMCSMLQSRCDEARTLYEQTLEIQRRVLGPEHPLHACFDEQPGHGSC